MTYRKKNKTSPPDYLVVGLNKSGSYWLAAMLDAHPEINCFPTVPGGKAGVGEPHFFDVLGSIDEDGGKKFKKSFTETRDGYFADLVPYFNKVSRDELYNMFRERYSKWCGLFRKKRLVGEKTQEYIFYLDIVDYFYPKIKKICIIRDPKDRTVSFYFNEARKGRQEYSTAIPDDFIEKFLSRVKKEYGVLSNYKGDMYCYTYESLKEDPAKTLTGLLRYLGAKVSNKIIATMTAAGSFERLSAIDKFYEEKNKGKAVSLRDVHGRKAGEELWTSRYRKGIVGDWKNHLSKKQARRIDSKLLDLHKKIFKKYRVSTVY